VVLRLSQGKPSSDFSVPDSQVGRWVDVARDRTVSDYLLRTTIVDLHAVDPAYIYTVTGLAIASLKTDIDTSTNPSILSVPLKDDKGLLRVRLKLTSDGSYIRASKVDMFNLPNLETMEFTKPCYDRPVCYRIDDIITLVGPTSAEGALNTLEIDYVPAMTGSDYDYSVSAAHVEEITGLAEVIGARELGIIIIDNANDGDQNN